MNLAEDLVVAGSGRADAPHPELIGAKPRAIIRYADAAAWITAAAVARATAAAVDRLEPLRHQVGLVVVSDQGPAETMRQVHDAADAGYSSPLHYAAANPGSLAGVACIAFDFRGPTLNLTMPPREGIPIMLLMATSWLRRGTARAMVVGVFTTTGTATGLARAMLIGSRDTLGSGEDVTAAARWLQQDEG